MKIKGILFMCLAFVVLCFASACKKNKEGNPMNLPLVKPPVQAATPAGLLDDSSKLTLGDFPTSEIKDRFFSPSPTEILNILSMIDRWISNVNEKTADEDIDCVDAAPVEYTVTPFGQSVTLYASCFIQDTGGTAENPKFMQFGKKDGTTYFYTTFDQSHVAAIVTPITGTTDKYEVQAWLGVGYINTIAGNCPLGTNWDSCSYGVMQFTADSSANKFELAAAGIGFGFFGVQLKSDGTNIYAKGSVGAQNEGAETTETCVAASDAATPATCSSDQMQFANPALGMRQTEGAVLYGPSKYPDDPNITLDGTDDDSLHFGPMTTTPGVASAQN